MRVGLSLWSGLDVIVSWILCLPVCFVVVNLRCGNLWSEYDMSGLVGVCVFCFVCRWLDVGCGKLVGCTNCRVLVLSLMDVGFGVDCGCGCFSDDVGVDNVLVGILLVA